MANWKEACKVATAGNITLSGAQTIDGVSVFAGDRVLVINQSDASANGIYVAASGSWSRASDASSSGLIAGMASRVQRGDTFALTEWALSTPEPIALDDTDLSFVRLFPSTWAPDVASLQSLTGMVGGEVAVVEGYYAPGDGGGGDFYFDTTLPSSEVITGATNATPIVVATSGAHGLVPGAVVMIAGVQGNTAANGAWVIAVTDASHFSLVGSSGNGSYTSGGVVGNAGTRIPNAAQSPDPAGHWVRIFSGSVHVRWFGATTSSSNNTAAIQAALDASRFVVIDPCPGTTFQFTGRLDLVAGHDVRGGGPDSCLDYRGSGTAIRYQNRTGTETANIELSAFRLIGGSSSQIGIELVNAYGVSLTRMVIDGQADGFHAAGVRCTNAFGGYNCAQVTVADSRISQCWKADRTVTFSPGSDRVNLSAHGYRAGDLVVFSVAGGGALGGGLTAGTGYYVVDPTANDFQVAVMAGATPIDITSAGSGTQTLLGLAAGVQVFYPASQTITLAAATDRVHLADHGYLAGDFVVFGTTGSLTGTGITAGAVYYVRDPGAGDFKISATYGGSAVDLTGAGSGAHYVVGNGAPMGGLTVRECLVDQCNVGVDGDAGTRGVPGEIVVSGSVLQGNSHCDVTGSFLRGTIRGCHMEQGGAALTSGAHIVLGASQQSYALSIEDNLISGLVGGQSYSIDLSPGGAQRRSLIIARNTLNRAALASVRVSGFQGVDLGPNYYGNSPAPLLIAGCTGVSVHDDDGAFDTRQVRAECHGEYEASYRDELIKVTPVVTFDGVIDRVNSPAHGYEANDIVRFGVLDGVLAEGLDTTVDYFVINAVTDSFQVSLSSGGAAVDITADGTGTQFIASPTVILPPANVLGSYGGKQLTIENMLPTSTTIRCSGADLIGGASSMVLTGQGASTTVLGYTADGSQFHWSIKSQYAPQDVMDIRLFGAKAGDPAHAPTNDNALARAAQWLKRREGGTLFIPAGVFWIGRTWELDTVNNFKILSEYSLVGNASTGGPPKTGSWLRCSGLSPGAAMIRVVSSKNWEINALGLDGLDEEDTYLAGRGVSVESSGEPCVNGRLNSVNVIRVSRMNGIRPYQKASDLLSAVVSQPAVGISDGGYAPFDDPYYPYIDITKGGPRGTAECQISLDDGLTWFNDIDEKVVTFSDVTNKVSRTAHGFSNGDLIAFGVTGGALATGVAMEGGTAHALTAGVNYQVSHATANDFKVALATSGALRCFDVTGVGSGTQFIARTSRRTQAKTFVTNAVVSDIGVPGSSELSISFSNTDDYSTDVFYRGEGLAVYVGNAPGVTGDKQVDNIYVRNLFVNATATAMQVESTQAVNCFLSESNLSPDKHDVIVVRGAFIGEKLQANGGHRNRSVIEIHRAALDVSLSHVYSEVFSGQFLLAPSNTREATLKLDRVVAKQSQGPTPAYKLIEYAQPGQVQATGPCEWWANDTSNEAVIVAWQAGQVDEAARYVGQHQVREVGGSCYYRGRTVGPVAGTYGRAVDEWLNSAVAFGRLIGSDASYLASVPATGIYREDHTDRLVMTDSNSRPSHAVDAEVTPSMTSELIRTSIGQPVASIPEVTRLARVRKGPVGVQGRAPLLLDDFEPVDVGSAFVWLPVDRQVGLGATMRASGTLPPTVTLSGDLTATADVPRGICIEILVGGGIGAAKFRWSDDDGATWIESEVPVAATYALLRMGVTVHFPAATYTNDNVYRVTCATLFDQTSLGGINASQATASKQPIYRAVDWDFNGLPTLEWESGNSAFLSTAASVAGQPNTFWVVGKCSDQSAARAIIDNVAGSLPNRQVVDARASSKIGVYAGTTDSSRTFDFTSKFLLSVEFNGASSKVYRNGSLVGTVSPGTSAAGSLVIGTDGSMGSNFWRGTIAEIFGMSGVPDGWQRRAIDRYLKGKWGVP